MANFYKSIFIGIILFLFPCIASANLYDGLVASYPFNQNANDETGNGNNGTVIGATLTPIDDFYSGYSFDGVNLKYISIPNNSSLNPEHITIATWVKLNPSNCDSAIVIQNYSNSPQKGYALVVRYPSNMLSLAFWNISGGPYNLDVDYNIVTGVWILIVATYDGQYMRMYVNGELLDSFMTTAGYTPSTISNMTIGTTSTAPESPAHYFNGIIEGLKIYNRALPENEIIQLYNNGFFPCKNDPDSDGVCNSVDDDECPDDPNKTKPGVCGCGTADTDTDSDGSMDCIDGCTNDPFKILPGVCGCGTSDADMDSDGAADCIDNCPSDAGKTEPGICGCGTRDTDTDEDGTADCVDSCPDDPNKIAPGNCGCGVADNTPISPVSGSTSSYIYQGSISNVIDGVINFDSFIHLGPQGLGAFAGPYSIRFNLGGSFDLGGMNLWNNAGNTEFDGEGINSFTLRFFDVNLSDVGSYSGNATDTLTKQSFSFSARDVMFVDLTINSNHAPTNRTYVDFYEINFNVVDKCCDDPLKTSPGVCGCGTADTDTDSDGVADCIDNCPGGDDNIDTDSDGIPNFCEGDTDDDGVIDQWDECPNTPSNSLVHKNGCPAIKGDLNDDGKLGLEDCIGILKILTLIN